MCRECVKEALPERGTVCLAGGAYLLNFAGCKECESRQLPVVKDRGVESSLRTEGDAPRRGGQGGDTRDDDEEEDEEEEEEVTTYKHCCASCGHTICEHYHRFQITEVGQEFFMECVLCGRGAENKVLLVNAEEDTSANGDATSPTAPVSSNQTPKIQVNDQAVVDGVSKTLDHLRLSGRLDKDDGSEDDAVGDDEWA